MKKNIIQLDSRFRGNDKRLEPILYTSTQILTNVMNRLENAVYDNHF